LKKIEYVYKKHYRSIRTNRRNVVGGWKEEEGGNKCLGE